MNVPSPIARILPGELLANPPLISLIFTNIVTIALAVLENWDLATVLFIYWAQSVIIGIFAVISILTASNSTLAGDLDKSVAEHGGTAKVSPLYAGIYKVFLAGFFTVHYGLFHWAYFGFVVEGGIFGPVDFSATGIWLSCALFFANHCYSYLYHRGTEPQDAEFITRQFFEPYNRIIPMHMTIIFGSIIIVILGILGIESTLPVLVFFLALKTWLDIKMHLRKHYEQLHPDAPKMYVGF